MAKGWNGFSCSTALKLQRSNMSVQVKFVAQSFITSVVSKVKLRRSKLVMALGKSKVLSSRAKRMALHRPTVEVVPEKEWRRLKKLTKFEEKGYRAGYKTI